MSKTVRATASVQVTLRIPADGCWAEGSRIETVHAQARDSVLAKLAEMMKTMGFTAQGAAVVQMVLVEEEK